MWVERQMFAIIQDHYNRVILQNKAHQTSSIKTDALMNLFLMLSIMQTW